ncbi:hypothetical protein DEO72_LG3g2352 [Vigna unguiculata]|uniref:Uncharacterized protein n=1 Tax=Vigna unguiculata TaxID=3917 RepID=A0A4D6LGP2_VIGUN|nr:hypothetical protein DEO72_LG3g2352 [Vigna unguiculata]
MKNGTAVEQSRQQCLLWEHHLHSKLLLNKIPPPPWLCNFSLHADPQGIVSVSISIVLMYVLQWRIRLHCCHGGRESGSMCKGGARAALQWK